ncbi:hypothetical protein BN938_2008 [Mucinivorans hirudinis]|uniref:Uncharacterized protein n=1 Tax=Mucinivorans hirudinis TaxID=1433126 RepID=A0A060R923_9BACT|nr:hypothetical protein BN938_2008 [Mucinivorans hirudinis]
MLGLNGFGHRKKPRSFEYKPRYFDSELQERENRRRAILGENYDVEDDSYRPGLLIREHRMRRMQGQARRAQKQGKVTLIRTVIFVLLVFTILWLATTYFGQSLEKR